jgi:hypothetical protein
VECACEYVSKESGGREKQEHAEGSGSEGPHTLPAQSSVDPNPNPTCAVKSSRRTYGPMLLREKERKRRENNKNPLEQIAPYVREHVNLAFVGMFGVACCTMSSSMERVVW